MARYDIPRPKRSDYTYQAFSGKWFDRRAYENAVAIWEADRKEFYSMQGGYVDVGGGNSCGDCNGTGVCNECDGTSWKIRPDGVRVRCKKCEPRGPKASPGDRGKCWPCHGRGTERPTRYRRS